MLSEELKKNVKNELLIKKKRSKGNLSAKDLV